MAKVSKARSKTTKSKSEKGDILTEMFQHFGIEVIDVNTQNPMMQQAKKKLE